MIKKTLLLGLVGLFLTSCSERVKFEKIAAHAVGLKSKQGNIFCSGTIIKEGLIITAAHCVFHKDLEQTLRSNEDLHVQFFDGKQRKAKVALVLPPIATQFDLALLEVDTTNYVPAQYRCDNPQRFSPARVVGYPAGHNLPYAANLIYEGEINQRNRFTGLMDNSNMFWGGTYFGFSGSGVISEHDRLFSVLVAMQGLIVYAVPPKSVCKFIDTYEAMQIFLNTINKGEK